MLQSVEGMVQKVPNINFVLNHMGNHHQICGNKKLEELWKKEIIKLSKYNNLCIKISALTGGLPGGQCKKWTFDIEREHIDFVIKYWNHDNIMYGSDWPPSVVPFKQQSDKDLFVDYWPKNLYYHLKKNYGKEFCDKIFYKNAQTIYNIPPSK